jgi:hypothetical protein
MVQITMKTSHVINTSPVHWRADCWLAISYIHSSYSYVILSQGVYRAVTCQCVDMLQYQCPAWQETNLWPSALHGYNRWILRWPQSGGFGLQLDPFYTRAMHTEKWTQQMPDAWGSWKLYPLPCPLCTLERHHLHVKHYHTWAEITFTIHLCNDGATKSPLQLGMEMDVDECRSLLRIISHSAKFWRSYFQSSLLS